MNQAEIMNLVNIIGLLSFFGIATSAFCMLFNFTEDAVGKFVCVSSVLACLVNIVIFIICVNLTP